jgi:hypothetical protein
VGNTGPVTGKLYLYLYLYLNLYLNRKITGRVMSGFNPEHQPKFWQNREREVYAYDMWLKMEIS